MSRPVLGEIETVQNITRDALEDHYRRFYVPENMCLAVVGNVDEKRLWQRIEGLTLEGKLAPPPSAGPFTEIPDQVEYRKDCHQASIVMGVDVTPLSLHHPDRFALALYNVILGGNASSRLFQEVREKRGLAYSIASDVGLLDGNGFFAVSAAMHPEKLDQVTSIINEEIDRSLNTPLDDAEAERAKNYVLGMLANILEPNYASGRRLLQHALFGEDPSVERFIDALESVSPGEIRACAQRYIDPAKLVSAAILPEDESNS